MPVRLPMMEISLVCARACACACVCARARAYARRCCGAAEGPCKGPGRGPALRLSATYPRAEHLPWKSKKRSIKKSMKLMCARGAGLALRWDAGGDARARQGGGGLAVRLRQLFYETSKTAHISCRFLASVEGLVFPRGEAFSGAFSSKERRLGPPFGSPASSRESIDGAFVLVWRGGLGGERARRSAPRFAAKPRVVLSSRATDRRDCLFVAPVSRSRAWRRARPTWRGHIDSRLEESAANVAQPC